MENVELTVNEPNNLNITNVSMSLDKLMEMSTMLSKSTIVPTSYQNRAENCFIALDMANRIGVSPMFVMQNLYIVQGKPSWSGSAIASMIRNSKEYQQVELVYVGKEGTDDWGAYVTAVNVKTSKPIKGATVTIGTAKKEGWFQKTGSKWQTMPELMLAYRSYAWFGRVHCPEIMMGLQSYEETEDVNKVVEVIENPYEMNGVK